MGHCETTFINPECRKDLAAGVRQERNHLCSKGRRCLTQGRNLPPLDLSEIIDSVKIRQTGESIAEWQHTSGMIPWFPKGHADPWNHIEAAMALDVSGFHSEATQAYQWLADIQLRDGSWHNYYLGNEVEQDKIDTNCVAYIATGVLHHYLISKDKGFLETMWAVVEPAIEFVLELQTPRGEIIWARHSDGTPWSYALQYPQT